MSKTLRLHTLAKELGIPSKEIIEKCRAEGIEIKNHMAAIPLGLAASIREWFSAEDDVTTVEVASPVDMERINKLRERSRRSKSKTTLAVDADQAATAIEEPEEAAEDTEDVAALAHEDVEPAEAPLAPAAESAGEPTAEAAAGTPERLAPVAQAPPQIDEPAQPAVAAEAPAPPQPVRREPAAEPKAPVVPAGPRVVPKPAELRGPRVVRIERPDTVPPPRPRPGFSPAASGGAPMAPPPPGSRPARRTTRDDEERDRLKAGGRSPRRQVRTAELATERVKEWRDQDLIERRERLASASGLGLRARRSAERRRQTSGAAPAAPVGRRAEVEITTPIALKDFCAALGVPYSTLSKRLLEQTGKLMRINERIDAETAEFLALESGVTLKIRRAQTKLERLKAEFDARERTHLQSRPPVVAMLGHVDHGKTSLLDAIRRTNVAAGEAGGITQHIGAYRIDRGDWHVTFLDTPGHEAFTSMRARGANLTDVVVLVVAADDGVMPQTIEAISHARAAGVPIVVALNKIDLPGVDVNRVYGQLAEQQLTPTAWGGETDVIHTSASKGTGINELVAHLSTLSDLMGLKADPTVPARATVIEAQMREGRGVVAQVLVREGTLRVGQIVVCGGGHGRVRALIDDRGQPIKSAEPGTPVEVVGLDALPEAGDELFVVGDLATAKEVAEEVAAERRAASLRERAKPQSLEELLAGGEEAETPELNIILRADVQGSVDALTAKLREFPSDKARLRILLAGVGAITEADVALARASKAVIIGFHVVPDERARQTAEQSGVDIRLYRIIYDVTDDVQRALEGLLEPVQKLEVRGRVEVREVFNITRVGRIAGCYVADGLIARSHHVRLVRDGRVVLEDAQIESLKRFKDDAREVRAGMECGVKLAGFDDVKPGDVLETIEVVEIAQKL